MAAKRNLLKSKTGSLFTPILKLSGYLVIVFGIVISISATAGTIFTGLVFIAVGGFFATSYSGIQLNPEKKAVKHYTSILGFKKGEFRSYEDYPFIGVIQKNKGSVGHQRVVFEVYLFSKSMRGKILVQICKSKKGAETVSKQLAKAFKVELVDYNNPLGVGKVNK